MTNSLPSSDQKLDLAVEQAVLKERQRCASIAKAYHMHSLHHHAHCWDAILSDSSNAPSKIIDKESQALAIAQKILNGLMSHRFESWYEGDFMNYLTGESNAPHPQVLLNDLARIFDLENIQ